MSTSQTPPPNVAFSPLSVAKMLWKRKGSALVLWITITAGVAAIVFRLPAIYSADALILVDSQKIPEKFVSSTVSNDIEDRITAISQQIMSSTSLKKIIQDFDLYHKERQTHFEEEILEMMRKDITIALDKSSVQHPGSFRVGFQGPNPPVVAQVANRLASLYIEENLKTREVQAEGTSEFIDNQLEAAKKHLDDMEAAVSQYKLQHNGELPQQESALSGTLARLQVELEANREAINRSEESKWVLENTLTAVEATTTNLNRPADVPLAPVPTPVSSVPTASVSSQQRSIETLQGQLDGLRARYSDDHPDVKRLRLEIARLRESTVKETATAPTNTGSPLVTTATPTNRPQVISVSEAAQLMQMRERTTTLKTQIAVAEKEVQARQIDQKRILRDISDAQNRLGHLPIREQEMAKITRDYEISKTNYRSLLDKKFAATMSTDMEHRQKSERFTLLDPARVPEKPTKPNRILLSSIGSFAGLVIGLAFGFGREFRKGALLGEWELPESVPVLARLPHIQLAVANISRPANSKPHRLKRKTRFVLVSSVVFSFLIVAAVGVYFVSHRF